MSTAFRVGIFVVLALLFLSIGIFSIGDKDFLLSSTCRLKAEFQNVGTLTTEPTFASAEFTKAPLRKSIYLLNRTGKLP
jgi:hypothetical protein